MKFPLLAFVQRLDWSRRAARVRRHAWRSWFVRKLVVRAYLWISIQWWCLLKIPRRFPPLTPPPRFFTVLEKHDALLSEALRVFSKRSRKQLTFDLGFCSP